MNCPRCQKVMLDVRAEKQNPKAPDFQCPDANCLNEKGYRTGAWLPKGRGASPAQAPPPPMRPEVPQAQSGAPTRDQALVRLYWDCFDEVLAGLKTRSVTAGFPGSEIAACVATMYIARSKVL